MVSTTFQPVVTRTDAKVATAVENLVSKTAPVADILKNAVDVPALTIDERKGLLDGPKADIYVDTTLAFRGAPIRALMAWSPKANAHFRANPLSRKVTFVKSAAHPEAVQCILKATVTFAGMGGDKLGHIYSGYTLIHRVQNYQAGITLGMKCRVQHIGKAIAREISTGLLTYEAVTLIATKIPATDELFIHLAKDLAHRRFRKEIPDPIDFEKYLDTMPVLKEAMNKVDAPHQAERQAAQDARVAQRMRTQAAEDRRAEKEYKARVETLQRKLNAALGGVVSLTQEEADLRRELGI